MNRFEFKNDPVKLADVYNSPEFFNRCFDARPLGALCKPESTTFRLWTPTAESVFLRLYEQGSGGEVLRRIPLEKMENGTWECTVPGSLSGIYYTYEVTNFGAAVETADPYARAAGVNGQRSMAVNLAETNPQGWKEDCYSRPKNQTDAVIWEVHVGDFSNDPKCGVRPEWRGKYLAFTEQNTTLTDGATPTCLNYLKKLGITHVQLMPVYDYGSIDESDPGKSYNWGYDPLNYNVPEGSYSTNAHLGDVRIREFKQMVLALHRAGIGVVMDVVYNHTYRSDDSWFHKVIPYYYHRVTAGGKFADGSACGNEVASERRMCRKYIIDSVLYWAREYHIDGFRFDLMGLLDVETMNEIRTALDSLPNGKKILMYGEPWNASAPTMAEGSVPADKSHACGLGPRIGIFSDNTRDAIRGDVFLRHKKGFVQGNTAFTDAVKASLQGWTQSGFSKPLVQSPDKIVSYISAHDNLTLWDKLISSTKRGRDYTSYDENIVKMNRLCAVLYLMAQGIPLFQAGEEFARTKRGMDNSFCAARSRNRLDWSREAEFSGLVQYYHGLIQIRKAFSALRDASAQAAKRMRFSDSRAGTVAFTLTEKERTIAVCVNTLPEAVTVLLKTDLREWDVLAEGERAGIVPLQKVQGASIRISGEDAVILCG